MFRGWKAIAAVAALALIAFGSSLRAEPWTIRVGWVVTPGHLAPLIEALGKREPGLFKHLGKSYVMQTTRFQGTTPQIQAQAIGELDIAAFSTAALALAITNARLDVRLVADVVADGMPGYFTENYVVLADGPIKTLEDVKGKRIATNAIGSASDAAMRAMFRKNGIKDADFTTVETNFANMPAMLDGGKVDDRYLAAIPEAAEERAEQIPGSVHRPRCRRADSAGDVVDARRCHRRAPAGAGRFFRRPYPRGALVHRPDQPGGRPRTPGKCNQAAEGGARIRLHQG